MEARIGPRHTNSFDSERVLSTRSCFDEIAIHGSHTHTAGAMTRTNPD